MEENRTCALCGCDNYIDRNAPCSKRIQELEKQLEIAESVVDFYAEPNHSYVNGLTTYTKYKDDQNKYEDMGYRLVLIGKRARESRAKINELRKGE